MNNFSGMGRLGKDPEGINTTSGTLIVTFSLAITRRFKNKQTDEYETDWLTCKAFGKTAEFIMKHFRKGSMMAVVGSVQSRSWDDNETGKKRYATEIIVEQVFFCGSKSESRNTEPAQTTTDNSDLPFPLTDDDGAALPFDL